MNKPYNELIINQTPEIKNLSENKIKSLLADRTRNLEEPNFLMSHSDLILVTALDHYVCKKLLDKEPIYSGSILDIYLKQIGKELQKQPFLLMSLPIFEANTQIAAYHIPGFNNAYQKCVEGKEKLKSFNEKLLNDQVTTNDINSVIVFLDYVISYNNVEINNDFYEKIVKCLLKARSLGLHSASFCFKYFGYKKCKEEKLANTSIFFAKLNNSVGAYIAGAIALAKDKVISTSFVSNTLEEYKYRSNDPFEGFALLKTTYHELRHAIQDTESNEMQETDLSFSMASLGILRSLDSKEYDRNYTTYDIESDANKYGYKQLINAMEKFVPEYNLLKNLASQLNYKYRLKYEFDYKRDENDKVMVTGEFLRNQLNIFFKEHPETLKTKYRQFLKFYKEDGEPLSLTDLLAISHSANADNTFFNYTVGCVRSGETIDINRIIYYTPEQRQIMARSLDRLIYIAYSKISFCKDRLETNNHFKIENFGYIDENILMINNCDIYYQTALFLANIANYLAVNYPELSSYCSGINRYTNLIEADSKIINEKVNVGKSITINVFPKISNGNGRSLY